MVGRALSRTQSALSCSVCGCIQHMNILPYVQYILVQGCNASATDEIEENLGVIVGVGVAFGIFQVRPHSHSHTHHTHYTHYTHPYTHTHLASLGTQASPVLRVRHAREIIVRGRSPWLTHTIYTLTHTHTHSSQGWQSLWCCAYVRV